MKGFLFHHVYMLNQKLYIYYLIAINCIAYVVMWYDKYQSKNKGRRISENALFLMAFAFGALGIYLGMKAPIYHKAAKAKFRWGIPLMIVVNGICIYVYSRLRSN